MKLNEKDEVTNTVVLSLWLKVPKNNLYETFAKESVKLDWINWQMYDLIDSVKT